MVSVGEDNPYGLPNEEIINRYLAAGSTVLSTAEVGDITVITDKKANMQISTFGK